MPNNIFIFAVIGCMAGTFLTGCEETPQQKVDNALENAGYATQELKDAQAEYVAKWRRFKRRSEQTINANEQRIDAFREKMEEAGPTFKAKYRNEVAVLEQKNRSLKKKLEEYKDDGQNKCEEFKTTFNDDMDGVGKTMTALFKDND
jgi:exonuclease VII large subunit